MKHVANVLKLDRLDLTEHGLSMFLGPTSTAVMCILWREPATIKHVWRELRKTDRFQETMYTTIATTCNRLAERGFLTRTNIAAERKPAFHFTPTMNETELIAFCIIFLLNKMRETFPDEYERLITNEHC